MSLIPRFLVFVISGLVLVTCQSDENLPSEPAGRLEVAGHCSSEPYNDHLPMDPHTNHQSEYKGLCHDAEAARSQAAAELEVDEILVRLSVDNDGQHLVPLGDYDSDFAGFVDAACNLGLASSLSADECLVPLVDESYSGGLFTNITAPGPGTWIARGPLAPGASVVIPGKIAILADEATGPFFLMIREDVPADPTDEGTCPGNHPSDCVLERFVFDFDLVNPDDAIGEYYLEICQDTFTTQDDPSTPDIDESSADIPYVCSAGGACQFADPADDLGLALCNTVSGRASFQSHTGASDSEDEERTRDWVCDVFSNASNVSENSLCTLTWTNPETNEDEVVQCITSPTEAGHGTCTAHVLVPGAFCATGTASHRERNKSLTATVPDICFAPGDPPRGGSVTTTFDLQPPGKNK